MSRRLFAIALFVCTLLATFGSASALTVKVTALSPVNEGTVASPIFVFEWNGPSNSLYRLQLRSVDGAQKLNIVVDNPACGAYVCQFQFYPGSYFWLWREHTEYTWQVKLLVDGNIVDKTDKTLFSTDFMPNITTFAPVDKLSVSDQSANMYFQWNVNEQYDEYRLKITRPDGSKMKSGWMSRTSICQGACIYNVDLSYSPTGEYVWRVEGRRNYVAGTTQSSKRTLKLD